MFVDTYMQLEYMCHFLSDFGQVGGFVLLWVLVWYAGSLSYLCVHVLCACELIMVGVLVF
jgi:hypothetical protein